MVFEVLEEQSDQGLFGPRLSSGFCEQQRRKAACASAQTDQCLCYSLTGKYNI